MTIKKESADWCILRTASRDTLRLVDQLGAIGIEAWSPRAIVRDVPPPLPKHKGSKVVRHAKVRERAMPITPSFLFAPSGDLQRLAELSHRPGRISAFTLFRHAGAIPFLTEAALAPLRAAEDRAAQLYASSRGRRRPLRQGQEVRMPPGAFGGMAGIVERCDGKKTVIGLGAGWTVEVASWLLAEDQVDAVTTKSHGMRQRASGC